RSIIRSSILPRFSSNALRTGSPMIVVALSVLRVRVSVRVAMNHPPGTEFCGRHQSVAHGWQEQDSRQREKREGLKEKAGARGPRAGRDRTNRSLLLRAQLLVAGRATGDLDAPDACLPAGRRAVLPRQRVVLVDVPERAVVGGIDVQRGVIAPA